MQPSLFDEPRAMELPQRFGLAKVGATLSGQILAQARGSLKGFDYTLNPYIGCTFACSYCYATFFVADLEKREDWGRWVNVKVAALNALQRHRELGGKKIFMSSATDPYQPIERKLELTRSLVEHMSERTDQPYLVVQTRSPLAARDIDLFRRFKSLRVNMSITTDSDAIRKQFEPACASIDRRIEAITQIRRAGLKVSVCLSPMLPLEDPVAFAKRLAAIDADHYHASRFHESPSREFAANTRDPALKLARELGWTEERWREAVKLMQPYLPKLNVWSE